MSGQHRCKQPLALVPAAITGISPHSRTFSARPAPSSPEPRDGHPQHEAARQPFARSVSVRAFSRAYQPLAQHHADLARRTRQVERQTAPSCGSFSGRQPSKA
ncbi:MAG: hypothetical protein ACLS7Z_03725 [Christensenellales bacterium]